MRAPVLAAALAAAAAPSLADAAPRMRLPQGGFQVYAVDAKGGGWVVHKLPGRGDTLWGCADVGVVESCRQVLFDAWRPAATLAFLHISRTSQDGWLKMTVPGEGDLLFACGRPETAPACAAVELDLRMAPAPSLDRVWPPYACNHACEGGERVGPDDPRYVIEDPAHGAIWVELGLRAPGASNLYACRGLGREPVCQLAVPNWLALDRKDLGIDKLVDLQRKQPDGTVVLGPGVRVDRVASGSVAEEAGLRPGMIIVKVGPFEVNDGRHARAMLAQYPALHPFEVTLDDGSTLELAAARRPAKGRR